ncbi:hypothetical protein KQH65_11560, partial [archaeon]|nr:hypothetical protein [archaeon]
THTYKVRAVDQLENTGEWSNTISVQIDTTGPTGSITINSGDASTTSRDVTLILTGDDAGSGLQDISFSNDGVDWSAPEVFTATKSWQLTEGLEEKTVYLRLRDNLGTTTIETDTILLEAEPADFTVYLDTGWNLISFPINLDDPSVASVMTGISPYTVKSWSGTEYITPTVFESGKAYWIKVESDVNLGLYGSDVTTLSLDLVTGYNLIGGQITSVQASDVLSGFYVVAAWNGAGYSSSTSFEPGTGYLVLVLSEQTVNMP